MLKFIKFILLFSAGSRYYQAGVFEVSKNETSDSPPPSSLPNNVPVRNNAIKVTLPNELEGVSYIQVSIQNGKN